MAISKSLNGTAPTLWLTMKIYGNFKKSERYSANTVTYDEDLWQFQKVSTVERQHCHLRWRFMAISGNRITHVSSVLINQFVLPAFCLCFSLVEQVSEACYITYMTCLWRKQVRQYLIVLPCIIKLLLLVFSLSFCLQILHFLKVY